ncbi:G-type lectin S-receptor-like serine/threonine-protein kinase SD2-2 [Carica papaya]|uniref:G-type lectin S-receptor-like serine/threonine-protein kinase SD2-2 n=1 Tax=Carica papaya TaxID=3649 RepID=UPI000B8D0F15|nr:G-type lectin S-receptor-like serine/threonine-protein kinase SD2-2 [Carica papaya]
MLPSPSISSMSLPLLLLLLLLLFSGIPNAASFTDTQATQPTSSTTQISNISGQAKPRRANTSSRRFVIGRSRGLLELDAEVDTVLSRSTKLKRSNVIISGDRKIASRNGTFQLGFFSLNGEASWYLGIWYASIPTPTYVWVANREKPVKNLTLSSLEINEEGQLVVRESPSTVVWQTTNTDKATAIRLLETGNLVLLRSREGPPVWQSFDYPSDTWLPGMNLTGKKFLTSWRSLFDPAPGYYSLRLNPEGYNEFQLVYNATIAFWSTGNWTGSAFSGVPQMTIPYIYRFHFTDPFSPTASFWYTEISLEKGLKPPLTRFQVDANGQLQQYTWSTQIENWNMFWSQPEDRCSVYGLCGDSGFCVGSLLKPCVCLNGFTPRDGYAWDSGDYSGGCRRESGEFCDERDGFLNVGAVKFDGATIVSFPGSRSSCEKSCLRNCSCVGLYHDGKTNLCKNLHGLLLNLRNSSSDTTYDDVLYIRVPNEGISKSNVSKSMVLVGSIVGSIAFLGITVLTLLILRKTRKRRKGMEEDVFPVLNLKVFSYKGLQVATKGFSEKLGHGGFGAVFRGELPDSTPVAVKRLERPGSGEKEFRAEVCTIGNIQHVNLVRLRGFCSENSHRLLVYDYMPNGPLSSYLCHEGPNLSWEVRFRVATGTARGIAYLHEECRDCIIHCDIKPENILLDSDYVAKVSDFGLAKLVGRDFSRVLATMRGTWGYVAPEWISGLAITTKADVYSYGMTLLELIGGRRNVEAPPPSAGNVNFGGYGEKWFFPPWAARQVIEGNIAAIIDTRLNGAYKSEEAMRLAMVAIWCIQDDEEIRPAMGMVVKMLEGVVEIAIPPPPKLIQALVSGDSYQGIKMDSNMMASTGGGCSDLNMGLSSAGSRSSGGKTSFLDD